MKPTFAYRKVLWLAVGVGLLGSCGQEAAHTHGDAHDDFHETHREGPVGPHEERTLDAATAPFRGYVQTATDAGFYSGPGTGHTLLRTIPANTRVFVDAGPPEGSWYQISQGGHQGYVEAASLKTVRATTIQTLPTTEKVVAFTFDAGSDRGYTNEILDILKSYQIKSSFGVTGKWALANPDLMARIASEGHHLFNHSFTHGSFTGFSQQRPPLTYEQRMLELWKTHDAIAKTAGANSKPYFRPPFGDYDNGLLVDLYSRGYDYNLMWSCDSLGWKGLTKEELIKRSVEFAKPGAVYLYHVGSQSQDGPALPGIIRELSALGYRFARVSDYVPKRPITQATAVRADAAGNVYATINGAERRIGTGGHQPALVGSRAVAYLAQAAIGAAQFVRVYDVYTGETASFAFQADLAERLEVHPASDGRFALIARGISGARAVPVLAVYSPDVGHVYSPALPATVESVSGDVVTFTLWDRLEGELEISPVGTESHNLLSLLNLR